MVVEIVYFAGPGRAELLKLIAEVGKIEYKYTGLQGESWTSHKSSTRYGQLPYLKVSDDFTVYQTLAIARYLAQEGGLYPSDRKEATLTEEIVCAIDEVLNDFVKVFYYTSEEKRPEELKKFTEGTLKRVFSALDKLLEKSGHFIGDKLTWADIFLFDFSLSLTSVGVDYAFASNIVKLKESVANNELVKAYLDSDRSLRKKQ